MKFGFFTVALNSTLAAASASLTAEIEDLTTNLEVRENTVREQHNAWVFEKTRANRLEAQLLALQAASACDRAVLEDMRRAGKGRSRQPLGA